MKPRDVGMRTALSNGIADFEREVGPLPGITDTAKRETLLRQMIDSIHRVRYPAVIAGRKLSQQVIDPDSIAFDPIKAAVVHERNGDTDEAFWLIFLFVHFGKHRTGGWRYLKEVYGGRGKKERWTWAETSADVKAFRNWLRNNSQHIRRKNLPGGFGNHRKYESLDADKPNGTGAVIESYVRWVSPPRKHAELVGEHAASAGHDPRSTFRSLYDSMHAVHRFGRTARFDYLAMVGKLGLATIAPGQAYLREATGPLRGARLLFDGDAESHIGHEHLEGLLQELDSRIHVGMQVLEDSLCNWQKLPSHYEPFRG